MHRQKERNFMKATLGIKMDDLVVMALVMSAWLIEVMWPSISRVQAGREGGHYGKQICQINDADMHRRDDPVKLSDLRPQTS